MNLEDFDYSLPARLIAQHPNKPRDACRLLIVDDGLIEKRFYNILDQLSSGDVLVLNSTRVIRSKLIGNKSTGSPAEIILTRKISNKEYECHIKTRNPNVGQEISTIDGNATIISKKSVDTFTVQLDFKPVHTQYLNPPYIRRTLHEEYQTVYADHPGSLAAPTAGLHFTKRLLDRIRKKGVKIVKIILHVGYGTFLPVYDMAHHKTEPEHFEISPADAKTINQRRGRLFVVGTTTLKALESASDNGILKSMEGQSDLFIKPGYRFQSGTDALITNFHLPKSSLLMLTSAFGGRESIMKAYGYAVKNNFRFYSLGDAMIVFRGGFIEKTQPQ